MTMPPKEIQVLCPNCGKQYDDWSRGSINLTLDNFDNDYIDACSSSVCPNCDHKVQHNILIVKDDVWRYT
jgi:endogenous inhibitor of DNA gyrase (YacG/DUF329 family)